MLSAHFGSVQAFPCPPLLDVQLQLHISCYKSPIALCRWASVEVSALAFTRGYFHQHSARCNTPPHRTDWEQYVLTSPTQSERHRIGGSRKAMQFKVAGKFMNTCFSASWSYRLFDPLLFTYMMDTFLTKPPHVTPFCLLTHAPCHICWSSGEMKLGLEDTPEALLLNHVLSVRFVTWVI